MIPFEFDGLSFCLFKWIFGLPCPGCGLSRAYLSLLNGQISAAFFYHPLFWLVPIIIGVGVFNKKHPILQRIHKSKWFYPLCIVLFIGVYAYRMLTLFPAVAPMDINRNALLWKLLSL